MMLVKCFLPNRGTPLDYNQADIFSDLSCPLANGLTDTGAMPSR